MSLHHKIAVITLTIAATVTDNITWAASKATSNQPLMIEADTVSFNDKTGITTYSGNVIAVQGEMRIQASKLVATLDANKSIKTASAVGSPAKFQQRPDPKKGLVFGQGNTIEYNATSGIATLSGNAFLTQDGSRFSGGSVRYDMKAQTITATSAGKKRVQIFIPAQTNK